MKPQTFIFVGRSGSGKGTQLDLLQEYLLNKKIEIKSIIMGEIFRNFFKESGFIQNIARDVSMKEGKFQPDFLTNALFIRNAIDRVDESSTLFFDGYPRNVNQLEIIKELLSYINRNNPTIINIEVSRESVKQRMIARARGDDTESAIESRLDEYDKFIVPMLQKIKNDPFFKYIEVDGEGTREEIHTDIINQLKDII